MKKTLAIVAIAALNVFASFGQSTVNFNNTATTFADSATVDRFVYLDQVGGTKLVGQNYAAALYWSTQNSEAAITQLAVLNATDTTITSARGIFRVATTASPGTWSGGARTLLGTTLGQQVFMQIRVWDTAAGANYDSALVNGGKTGKSAIFSYTTSSSPTPPPSDLVLLNLRAFALVPEPSTIALGVLGLGSLLLFRRRK
jgi:hypothetical protein